MDDQSTTTPVAPGQLEAFPDKRPPVEPWADNIMPRGSEEGSLAALEEEAAPSENLTPGEMGFNIRVAPDLKPLVRPIDSFEPHPRNLRKHNLEAIAFSLNKYGQQTPCVVQRSTGYICKGNGTWKAAKGLGATELAFSVEDFDDDTAYRYLLADNRASDLARYEREALAEALQQLVDGAGLQDTLWTPDDVDDIRAELGTFTIVEPPDFKGGYSENPEDRAKREQQSTTPADKMREVPIVMNVADHQRFMANIATLKKAYGTTGTIATVVEAVRREAVNQGESDRGPTAELAAPEPEARLVDPLPEEMPPAQSSGEIEENVGQDVDAEVEAAIQEPTEEELLARLDL